MYYCLNFPDTSIKIPSEKAQKEEVSHYAIFFPRKIIMDTTNNYVPLTMRYSQQPGPIESRPAAVKFVIKMTDVNVTRASGIYNATGNKKGVGLHSGLAHGIYKN